MKKNAFTLAEVLITLGIIGVVAALTLPTLIQNHQKQVYVNELKKVISTSQNMLKQMQANEGASDIGSTHLFSDGVCVFDDSDERSCEDSYGNSSVFEEVVPKYLKVVKTCKGEACNRDIVSAYLSCNNNKCKNITSGALTPILGIAPYSRSLVGFYSNDGAIYYMFPHRTGEYFSYNKIIGFIVDVNGEKGPNTENVDIFNFGIDKNGKLCSIAYVSGFEVIEHLINNGWKMDY